VCDALLQGDIDACAGEAVVLIEAVLAARCPELSRDFWRAVEKLYRPDFLLCCKAAASSSSPDLASTAQTR
jgi:hypothetical protein